MRRRDFISSMVAAGVGAAAGPSIARGAGKPRGRLAQRRYGHTRRKLSIVGLGGIVVSQIEQSEANDIVAWAVDRGVTYFDVAPTYGNAQERLGPALKPYRDRSFLACKTTKRDAAGAQAELEESLRLLQTDHVDLYQLHGLSKEEEVDAVMAPGGALETFVRAREKGQALHLGFSAHSVPTALKALDAFHFDSVLFPLNAVCIENGHFGPQVLEAAARKGTACLALKALAWTPWPQGAEHAQPKCWYEPITDRELVRLALTYTLSLPVAAAIPPGDPEVFKMAVELGLIYSHLTGEERAELLRRMAGVEPIFKNA